MENLFGLLFSLLNNLKNNIFFISGPTAIGKSSLAIRIAKKNKGVIVNADSMQVYSNLEILTARPSKKDQNEIKHELYGYVGGDGSPLRKFRGVLGGSKVPPLCKVGEDVPPKRFVFVHGWWSY